MQCQRVGFAIGMLGLSLVGGVLGGFWSERWGASAVAAAAQSAPVVTARQVNLVDASGVLRAVLSARDERGMASLAFYDSDGQVRGVVGIEPTGRPFLRMLNRVGERRLLATIEGEDALVITGDEAARSGMFGSVAGSPMLAFRAGGLSRVRLQLNRAGQPNFGLFDASGRRGATLVLDDTEAPLFTLYKQNRPRVTLGVVQEATVLNMGNADRTHLVMGVRPDGHPSLSFYDEEGNIFEHLPVSR